MSIDATVTSAKLNEDGTVKLHLSPTDGCEYGEHSLTVLNPPADVRVFMNAMIGQLLWGGASEVMVRDKKWADRVTTTEIRLVDKPNPPVGDPRPD